MQLLEITTKVPIETSAGIPVGREAQVWMTVLSPMETSLSILKKNAKNSLSLLHCIQITSNNTPVPEITADSGRDLPCNRGIRSYVAFEAYFRVQIIEWYD